MPRTWMSYILTVLLASTVALAAVIYVSSVAGRRIHRFMSVANMEQRLSTDLPKGFVY